MLRHITNLLFEATWEVMHASVRITYKNLRIKKSRPRQKGRLNIERGLGGLNKFFLIQNYLILFEITAFVFWSFYVPSFLIRVIVNLTFPLLFAKASFFSL